MGGGAMNMGGVPTIHAPMHGGGGPGFVPGPGGGGIPPNMTFEMVQAMLQRKADGMGLNMGGRPPG